jgi:hypothetical protein
MRLYLAVQTHGRGELIECEVREYGIALRAMREAIMDSELDRKVGIRGVKGRTEKKRSRLDLVGRGVKGPSETRFFRSKDRKKWTRPCVCSSMRSAEIFSERSREFGDRSGSIGAASNIRASECVRACEVGPIAQRSEIDRARGNFPRASNEVRDRSERSKIVRRC